MFVLVGVTAHNMRVVGVKKLVKSVAINNHCPHRGTFFTGSPVGGAERRNVGKYDYRASLFNQGEVLLQPRELRCVEVAKVVVVVIAKAIATRLVHVVEHHVVDGPAVKRVVFGTIVMAIGGSRGRVAGSIEVEVVVAHKLQEGNTHLLHGPLVPREE